MIDLWLVYSTQTVVLKIPSSQLGDAEQIFGLAAHWYECESPLTRKKCEICSYTSDIQKEYPIELYYSQAPAYLRIIWHLPLFFLSNLFRPRCHLLDLASTYYIRLQLQANVFKLRVTLSCNVKKGFVYFWNVFIEWKGNFSFPVQTQNKGIEFARR